MARPTLYLMMGYPGAGKTTTAKLVEELTGAVRLTSDEYRFKMFQKPTFSDEEHAKLYDELDKETERLLTEGKSVIYDANLNRYEHRRGKYEISERTGAKPVLLWVKTPRETAKERASHESRLHLAPGDESLNSMFERIASLIEAPGPEEDYIEVDGTKILHDYVAGLLK